MLIDDYIVPMLASAAPDCAPLLRNLIQVGAVMLIGVIAAFAYNRIMVGISQGTMRRLRIDIFSDMESLPIKFFDTTAHGDIMSVYTNDVDTLRQLMGQSIPQVINSLVTLISTFVSMLILNIPLTLMALVMAGVMVFVTARFSSLSGYCGRFY